MTTPLTVASLNCENPKAQLDDSIEIVGYQNKTQVAERGSSISFSCSPGLVMTGPNLSTCMGNGEWDPREVRCKGVVI